MMAPKSMAGIFHDLQTNRLNKTQAAYKFVVISLTKKGTPRTVTADDLRYNGTVTMTEALVRQAAMAQNNPGTTYTIQAL